ncbi:hypothetical protein ONE63_010773 [Megalurothrips usitatus]|uniref:Large ribosomal subunit protein mL44 n=1 Tax=Megalurothrips usitatus TaxID=439358 RepID=A0AAV7XFZ4_9NEOP|nr:hypothetical protein ONE63_010773 [Megalurothrips usitatus]
MATIRCCYAGSKLFNNALKPCALHKVFRTAYMSVQSDERVEMLRELLKRKKEAGPEKPTHRNTYLEWNYQAELYAFSKRLGENFVGNTLERAFTQRSYVIHQESLQKELGLDDPERSFEDNKTLAMKGEELTRNFVSRYLRTAVPCLPEEGIQHIRDHLLKEDNVANIISKIGADELILCTDFPTEVQTRVSTFFALVGAIEESSGQERGALFVRDFLVASLSGQDIQSLIMPENPLGVLTEIYSREGKEAPEPRLIVQAGVNTLIPSYRVALYSDKKYIGLGDGESVKIAVDNAALGVLWQLWGIPDGRFQFPYHLETSRVLSNSRTNVPESEWTRDRAKKNIPGAR